MWQRDIRTNPERHEAPNAMTCEILEAIMKFCPFSKAPCLPGIANKEWTVSAARARQESEIQNSTACVYCTKTISLPDGKVLKEGLYECGFNQWRGFTEGSTVTLKSKSLKSTDTDSHKELFANVAYTQALDECLVHHQKALDMYSDLRKGLPSNRGSPIHIGNAEQLAKNIAGWMDRETARAFDSEFTVKLDEDFLTPLLKNEVTDDEVMELLETFRRWLSELIEKNWNSEFEIKFLSEDMFPMLVFTFVAAVSGKHHIWCGYAIAVVFSKAVMGAAERRKLELLQNNDGNALIKDGKLKKKLDECDRAITGQIVADNTNRLHMCHSIVQSDSMKDDAFQRLLALTTKQANR